MTSSNFASFAPYTPPPDDPQFRSATPPNPPIRPWFPTHASSAHEANTSYQSGGIPSFGTSTSSSLIAGHVVEAQQNQWETRYGMRVDVLAALAYVLGPISALMLLIVETQNDYVRFHAYQSALLTTPLLIMRIFLSLVQAYPWIRMICTLCLIICQGYMAVRAYLDALHHGLVHRRAPIVGPLSERWLAEE